MSTWEMESIEIHQSSRGPAFQAAASFLKKRRKKLYCLCVCASGLNRGVLRGAVSGYSGVSVEIRRSGSHHNAPEDAAHAWAMPLSFNSGDPRSEEPPSHPPTRQLWEASTSPDPSAEPGLRRSGETVVLGSTGLTAWEEDVESLCAEVVTKRLMKRTFSPNSEGGERCRNELGYGG